MWRLPPPLSEAGVLHALKVPSGLVARAEQLLVVQVAGALLGSAGAPRSRRLSRRASGRGVLLGRYHAFTVVGSFAGSLLSGLAYQHLGYRNTLRLAAILNLIPLALISAVPEPQLPARALSSCSAGHYPPREAGGRAA